jgi:hypothetical protein
MSRCSRGTISGRERRPWEKRRRWEGGRGCRTIRSPTRTSVGRRGSRCVCFVEVARIVFRISPHRRKNTDSVICPHNGERLTFVGQDGVNWQYARHGLQNALMKARNCPCRPHAICLARNLFGDERGIVMLSSSGLHCSQPLLVCRL